MRRLLTGTAVLGLAVLAGCDSGSSAAPAANAANPTSTTPARSSGPGKMVLPDAEVAKAPPATAKAVDPKPAPTAGSFAALKMEFDAALAKWEMEMKAKMQEADKERFALQQALRAAKTADERKAAEEKLDAWKMPALDSSGNPAPVFGPKFLAFAEKNPADPKAAEAVTLAVQMSGGKADAIAAAGRVVKAVMAKNPDRKVQFAAAKVLAAVGKQTGTPDADIEKAIAEKYADLVVDLSVGKPVPEVEATDLSGKPVKLSALKGRVVVLDIWATWCGPCRAMIPHEREMVGRLKDKPFTLVSLSIDDAAKTVADFVEKEPMPWTHWWVGPRGAVVADWEIRGIPNITVIDAKGVVRHKGLRGEALEEAVNKLLAEMKSVN